MRRTFLTLALLLAATATWAASPFFLDRNGVLWTASSIDSGLLLSGQQNGTEVVHSVVPFAVGLAGTSDTQIQVAADDITGKVAVVWQRNWSAAASEIMMAVWRDGSWERIEHLSQNLDAHPRNPVIQLSEVSDTVPDPTAPDDPTKATLVQDSFLHVLWWEGADGGAQNAEYALLRLTGDPSDPSNLLEKNLDSLAGIGLLCNTPAPPDVLEHPLFAAQTARDKATAFFGSERNCLFQLLDITFVLDDGSSSQAPGGMTAVAQRRRHMPIFGVEKAFPMVQGLSMEGARLILGTNLFPVVYRVVNGNTVEYMTATDAGWTPRRTLAVADGLTMDQAIPLVENLAR
jgi:hypothetical protein